MGSDRKYDIAWKIAIGTALVHVAGLYGLYYSLLNAKFVTMFYGHFAFIASGAGVTIGAHRLFTHRAFKVNQVTRFILMLLFTMSGENNLYVWVRNHRQHHKYSDTDADPHNIKRGFFFSHVGWLMVRRHPEAREKSKTVDLSDIENDPIIKFHRKYYLELYVATNALTVMIPCLLWNEAFWASFCCVYAFRTMLIYNVTWSVNSLAHLYGNRPYNRKIQPVESKFVSLITYGEGWHNFHHVFPSDYRASEFGRRYDLGTRVIEWLQRRGYAYDLRDTPQDLVDKWAKKFGDGSPTARKELQTIQYHESNDDECTKDESFASRKQEESATA
ncbi:acyl-CoA Delta-9 desaturase-like [Periplaneta americana]|uniref:acyl-CoA Delta-9 desaturase-like n=1 Tax=Periplaneta americana TaxID=6978 RepID=UPI0037E88AD1